VSRTEHAVSNTGWRSFTEDRDLGIEQAIPAPR
jgi:hypothetical protein